MASRSVNLELDPHVSIAPQSIGGAVTGASVDLEGCEAALVVLDSGAATTAATVKIQESGDDTNWNDVDPSNLIGYTDYQDNYNGVAMTASTVLKVSYLGDARYIRVSTLAGASAALFAATVIRAHLRSTAGQPA